MTGLSPAQRSVPLFLMLGDRDDRVTGPAGIEALPLDADILLSLPVNPFVVVTEAFGYDPLPCQTDLVRGDTLLLLEFCASNPENTVGVMIFALIGGMGHQYPKAGNNDAKLRAAAAAWAFFVTHPLR